MYALDAPVNSGWWGQPAKVDVMEADGFGLIKVRFHYTKMVSHCPAAWDLSRSNFNQKAIQWVSLINYLVQAQWCATVNPTVFHCMFKITPVWGYANENQSKKLGKGEPLQRHVYRNLCCNVKNALCDVLKKVLCDEKQVELACHTVLAKTPCAIMVVIVSLDSGLVKMLQRITAGFLVVVVETDCPKEVVYCCSVVKLTIYIYIYSVWQVVSQIHL